MKFSKNLYKPYLAEVYEEFEGYSSFQAFKDTWTLAETEAYEALESSLHIESVFENEEGIRAIATTYSGFSINFLFPTWAAYYDAMLTMLLGEVI